MDIDIASSSASRSHAAGADLPDWASKVAPAGYIAKGVVYGMVGVLALLAAFGQGGSTEGTRGAIQEIGQQPYGTVMLVIVGVGLVAYVLWRLAQSFFDAEGAGSDAKGLVRRAAFFVSACTYGLLAFFTFNAAFGGGGSSAGGGGGSKSMTAELMSQPFGRWLVGIVGAVVVGVGLYQGYRAWSKKFMEKYDTSKMSPTERTWAKRFGVAGLAARCVTFLIIGGFVIEAAATADPQETKGLGGALRTLASQPYGTWLLAIVAAGLVAYGVYCFSRAFYRDFETSLAS